MKFDEFLKNLDQKLADLDTKRHQVQIRVVPGEHDPKPEWVEELVELVRLEERCLILREVQRGFVALRSELRG